MAAQAGSSGDLQHGRVAGLVPTALMIPGCQGYHDPQNGPKRPDNPADDPNFGWNWEDRSCKQHKLLTDLDDQLSMRSLPPTPREVYRLRQHFEGRKDLNLQQLIEGLRCYPKWLGFPCALGTTEFTLCKCLLAISRSNGPGNVVCFCLPQYSLMIYGCEHSNLGYQENGATIYNTQYNWIGCSNCSKCLRCKGCLVRQHFWMNACNVMFCFSGQLVGSFWLDVQCLLQSFYFLVSTYFIIQCIGSTNWGSI